MSMKNFHIVFALALFMMVLTAAAPVSAQGTADWTILSYLAADNELEKNALADINEMESAGPAPNINIIVQLDRPASGYNDGVNNFGETVRIKIAKDTDKVKISSPIVAKLGSLDSGDPKNLANFIEWGIKNYPAKRYILVLWCHGSGWKTSPPDQIGARSSDGRGPRTKYLEKMAARPDHYTNNLRSLNLLPLTRGGRDPLYPADLANIGDLQRSVAYDYSSHSAITLNQLRDTIQRSTRTAGLSKGFDIVWFDACLMSMAEVAHAMSGCADYMIASEEVTPDFGWNHVKIVNAFNKNFALATPEMAKLIVAKFVESYRRKSPAVTDSTRDDGATEEFLPVTMNALDLSKTAPLAAALNDFAAAAADPMHNPAITDALATVQRFQDNDFVDLLHFVDLVSNAVASPRIAAAAAAVKKAAGEMVIASKNNAPAFRNARGASIYFPAREYDRAYDSIFFSTACSWNAFIKSYLFPKNSAVVAYDAFHVESANGDGRIAPNDTPAIAVTVVNTGAAEAKDCVFTLNGKNAGAKITASEARVPSIASGARATIHFKLSTTGAKAGQKLSFQLMLAAGPAASTVRIATLDLEVRQPFAKTSDILLVFGTPDPAVEPYYTAALDSLNKKYDIWRASADGAVNPAIIGKYRNGGVVIRVAPDSSIQNKITREEVIVWENFLKNGGSLLITGQDIGAMIGETDLYTKYFKCRLASDSGGNTSLQGLGILAGKAFTLNGADSANNQLFLDDVTPLDGATPILNYFNGKTAGVLVNQNAYRLIYLAFGLEAVAGVNNRAEILSAALSALPFTLTAAVESVRRNASAEAMASDVSREAAIASIDVTREAVLADLAEAKYDSAEKLAATVAETPAAGREPFMPILRAVNDMLRAKLVQSELPAEEAAKVQTLLAKINAIK